MPEEVDDAAAATAVWIVPSTTIAEDDEEEAKVGMMTNDDDTTARRKPPVKTMPACTIVPTLSSCFVAKKMRHVSFRDPHHNLMPNTKIRCVFQRPPR